MIFFLSFLDTIKVINKKKYIKFKNNHKIKLNERDNKVISTINSWRHSFTHKSHSTDAFYAFHSLLTQ